MHAFGRSAWVTRSDPNEYDEKNPKVGANNETLKGLSHRENGLVDRLPGLQNDRSNALVWASRFVQGAAELATETTGALTSELVMRLGPTKVAAVDPFETFVAATRERHPGVDVRASTGGHLPFPNATFDAALAQLVVHFMNDPVARLAEMGRVTRRDGVVAACVWDHGGGDGPLRIFWDSARTLDPKIDGESQLAGGRKGHLAELF